jgi:hypothetical protein
MEVACSTEMLDSTTSSSRCPVPVRIKHNPNLVFTFLSTSGLQKMTAELLCFTVSLTRSYCHECDGVPQAMYWLTYGIDDQWLDFRFPAWARNFYVLHGIRTVFEAHPPSCPVDSEKSLLRKEAAGHESDRLRPSTSTVKNAWIYASLPHVP